MKILVILSIFSVIVLIIGISVKGLKFIHDIIDSLTTEKGGFSTKKILVYIGIIFAGTGTKTTITDTSSQTTTINEVSK